ncbi:MAG TPA: hypothetical protein VJT09_04230 [Pyrinomonadaceae bacterium]|nr:hypothetical protein [Pyrinomonadaceae bacterium]
MRTIILSLLLMTAALLLTACGSSQQSKSSNGGAEAMPTATVRTPAQSAQAPGGEPAVPAHGVPPVGSSAPQAGGSSGTDTTALDKKVEQAEAKAKAPGAKQADKMAAASAYLERANVFYKAGNPSLYKFALRDFRRTLRYDPNNEEARAKRDQIEDIYTNSLGRPVPDLGNEP